MRSHATPRFWRLFHGLPAEVQRLAVKTFGPWQVNPNRPLLRYRRLVEVWRSSRRGPTMKSRKLRSGMSGLRQVEELLPGLSRAEKAHLLRLVVQDLDDAFPGIDSTPEICGGEPCIVRTRIPVWALEQSRRLGISEDELLRSYPTLRAEDLVNAWAYVRSHRTEIEDEIRENENA